MKYQQEHATGKLLDRKLISEPQFNAIISFRNSGFFSIRNEVLGLMYISVLMFAAGAGVIIYNNIDSIGHTLILTAIALLTLACFYFCFINSPKFSRLQVTFEHPAYDYLVLLSTLLTCVFITYLQFQFKIFGAGFNWTALIGSLVAFAVAYRFDNRSSLSIAITGLAAFIGITITPQAVIDNEVYSAEVQTYYGIALSYLLMVVADYSERTDIKRHFSIVYWMFALHLLGICCVKGMFESLWPLMMVFYAVGGYFLYKKSSQLASVSMFAFNLIYGYLIINIFFGKLFDMLAFDFLDILIYIFPLYLIGSIVMLILAIKRFNTSTNDGIR